MSRIFMILVPFDRSHRDLQNGTKIIKIRYILIFRMHQKKLCNAVVIVRVLYYSILVLLINNTINDCFYIGVGAPTLGEPNL